MPLSKESKRYVRKRVEKRHDELMVEMVHTYFGGTQEEVTAENALDLLKAKTFMSLDEIDEKMTTLYTKAISFWKEKKDTENSERAAYALAYFLRKFNSVEV